MVFRILLNRSPDDVKKNVKNTSDGVTPSTDAAIAGKEEVTLTVPMISNI